MRRPGFLEKTLHELATAVQEEFFASRLAERQGLLQGIDPRVKVFTVLYLIGIAGLVRKPQTLVALHLWIMGLAWMSSLPLGSFLKKVWLVVPLFTGVIVFPSLFNFILPGDPLLVIHQFDHGFSFGPWSFPAQLTITRQGAAGAAVLLLRTGASVSLALLLALTTRWPELLRALRAFFVPRAFLAVLEMTFRYIFLFLETTEEVFTARKSRSVGNTPTREQHRFISGAIGALWEKTLATAEEVHSAMISRGYGGQFQTLADGFRTGLLDWLWLAFVILAGLFFWGGDRWIGR
ncbi:MAG: cobalt ECF transporter T component CbiQ [Desulfotomaculales bacterium]